MSNTNIPPDVVGALRDLATSLERNLDSGSISQRLIKNNTRELSNLKRSFIEFATPMVRLQDSFKRMDETNRKITQMGTTYAKLQQSLEKNSTALDDHSVSNRALLTAIAENYNQGIRVNSAAMLDLTSEMIATGQNTESQRKMNASLILQTGYNTEAITRVNAANKELSDDYMVTNERLINSVNSLKSSIDGASLFGAKASADFTILLKEMTARSGGADITAGLSVFTKMITPGIANMTAANLVGAMPVRDKIAAGGGVSLQDADLLVKNIAKILEEEKGSFRLSKLAPRLGISKEEVIPLQMLVQSQMQSNKIQESMRASQNDKFNNLKTLEDKSKDFYDNTSKGMLTALGSIDTNLLLLGVTMAQYGGLAGGFDFGGKGSGKGLGKLKKFGNFIGGMGKARIAGGIGVAASMGSGMMEDDNPLKSVLQSNTVQMGSAGAIIGNVPGAVVGAILGGILDIVDSTEKTAEATGSQAKMNRDREMKERAADSLSKMNTLNNMISYLRSRTTIKSDESIEIQRASLAEMKRLNDRRATTSTGR